MNALRITACYAGIFLLVIAIIPIMPKHDEALLVVQGAHASDEGMYGMMEKADAFLLTRINDHVFVVKGNAANKEIIDHLYESGAFLVLNAASLEGCSSQVTVSRYRRTLS